MLDDDGGNSQRVDVAEIVVHENVSKTADLSPGNRWELRFEFIGE